MPDEKIRYEQLPIPTYEEATASDPGSSQLGPEHSSDDLERQGLLQHDDNNDSRHNGGYHPPTVESARSSIDYLASSAASSARNSVESLRRELHQMDVDDSGGPSSSRRPLLGYSISKHFSNPFSSLTKRLSSIQLPFRNVFPSFHFPRFWQVQVNEEGFACMVFLRLFGILIVVSLIYLVFISDVFAVGSRFSLGQSYTPSSVENFVQSHINETNIANNLEKATQFAHIAGTEGSYVLAEWIEQEFAKAGLEDIEMEEFQVYLNYPRVDGRRVAIVDPPELAWEAAVDEEPAYKDRQNTLVFHGHSKSGNVTGPLIYANYGSLEDFKLLADSGISVEGAIVLVRYYGTQGDRALKVKAAELAGAAGCIIYSDPQQDGFVQGPAYPDGRYMPSDGVQRGAVSLMSWVVGDVLSPGFASTPKEKKRLKPEESAGLVQIPSIPLAWRDAQRLLQVLKGHGSKVPSDWVGGVPEVSEWWTGDLSSSPKVNLMNLQDEVERQPIYNVLGRITGLEQPEKKIIVGNHRDSWCFGGVDPGSGTATFLEVVRVFGELKSVGWRPLRTIEFASWDGEEYNLIGSTEHVEKDMDKLRNNGIAYMNVDVGVSGNSLEAAGSPVFRRLLHTAMGRVSDESVNKTLKEIWEEKGKRLEGLGAGSDYVAFQDMAGTSSLDFTFGGDPFPYHSCYENFDWMVKFGDPDFRYHRMLGELWALMLLELADSPIVPFDLEAYALEFTSYVQNLQTYAQSKGVPLKSTAHVLEEKDESDHIDLQPLHDAAEVFRRNTQLFQAWEQIWYSTIYGTGGFESNLMGVRRVNHNDRISRFETNLLDLSQDGGVPNRTQFKHVLFAPQTWCGYDEAYFPAIRDAIDIGNWNETQHWINRVAEIVTQASEGLNT